MLELHLQATNSTKLHFTTELCSQLSTKLSAAVFATFSQTFQNIEINIHTAWENNLNVIYLGATVDTEEFLMILYVKGKST